MTNGERFLIAWTVFYAVAGAMSISALALKDYASSEIPDALVFLAFPMGGIVGLFAWKHARGILDWLEAKA